MLNFFHFNILDLKKFLIMHYTYIYFHNIFNLLIIFLINFCETLFLEYIKSFFTE